MTRLLEEALSQLAKLPDDEQDAIARWLLEELESEERWHRLLADSEEKLSSLADDALAEYKLGRTQGLEPESL